MPSSGRKTEAGGAQRALSTDTGWSGCQFAATQAPAPESAARPMIVANQTRRRSPPCRERLRPHLTLKSRSETHADWKCDWFAAKVALTRTESR